MSNPKKQFGDKKPPLMQVTLAALVHGSMAHMDGALKYGNRNWRETKVDASTYINAAMRHLLLWAEGEETARDTGVHNLGGVIACMSILLDAQTTGMLIDDRVKSPAVCDLLHKMEAQVTRLKEAQKLRDEIAGKAVFAAPEVPVYAPAPRAQDTITITFAPQCDLGAAGAGLVEAYVAHETISRNGCGKPQHDLGSGELA